MARMTNKQSDYAIKRASAIINEKYTKRKTTISLVSVLLAMGVTEKEATIIKEANDWNAKDFKTFALEYLPIFDDWRKQLKKINAENYKITQLIKKETESAKDFIMLGESEEVLQFLKNLEN